MANDEWYTPPDILGRAVKTLGRIGFDPCCSPASPAWLLAERTLTLEQDALSVDWCAYSAGPLWLNPPYSNPAPFVDKAIAYGKPSLVLVNTSTDSAWGQRLLQAASVVLFMSPRVRFLRPRLMSRRVHSSQRDGDELPTIYGDLVQPAAPRYSNMLVLLNPEYWQPRLFKEAFAGMGTFMESFSLG